MGGVRDRVRGEGWWDRCRQQALVGQEGWVAAAAEGGGVAVGECI